MSRLKLSAYFILIILFHSQCRSRSDHEAEKVLHREFTEWKKQRIDQLKSRNGWLNLAGLYWLEQGINSFGSDSSNNIIFPPDAPPFCGEIRLSGDKVSFKAHPPVVITSGGNSVTEKELITDQSQNPTILETGSFAWFIIKRGDRYGIRLRDFDHPRIKALDSIPCYPFSPDWLIKASFIPFESPRKISVGTVTGGTEVNDCPGKLVFKVGEETCILLPFSQSRGLFIIFADKTSGSETYGVGRFLYAPLPDKDNMVLLNFNKAYNPPCSFSPFATCPMPPLENILSLPVTAGEKKVHLD